MPPNSVRAAPPPREAAHHDSHPAQSAEPRSRATIAPEVAPALDVALRYAAAGWPVFPCQADRKEPATDHGFKDATTDPDQIRRWWTRCPAYNVAIATGAPGPDVVDVDVKPEGNGWAAFNRLKRAGLLTGAFAMIRTRSGGMHVYFAGTGQRCTTRIGDTALDFRAAGGYVIAPPSYVAADAKGPGGRYEVIEKRAHTGAVFDLDAACALLAPPRPARQSRPRESTGTSAEALAKWVMANAKPEYRHEPIRWMTKKLADSGQLDEHGSAAVLEVAMAIGLAGGEREALKVIRSYGGTP